jgi:hypothetical protein
MANGKMRGQVRIGEQTEQIYIPTVFPGRRTGKA